MIPLDFKKVIDNTQYVHNYSSRSLSTISFNKKKS